MSALLWTLLALFALRVSGQLLVAAFGVTWLPPMERWYSGLLPYEYLLPSQIVILAGMAKICLDYTRGNGYFVQPRRFLAGPGLWFGWLYLAGMLVRYLLQQAFAPSSPVIPIFFHWVLAGFIIAVGAWHRRRLLP